MRFTIYVYILKTRAYHNTCLHITIYVYIYIRSRSTCETQHTSVGYGNMTHSYEIHMSESCSHIRHRRPFVRPYRPEFCQVQLSLSEWVCQLLSLSEWVCHLSGWVEFVRVSLWCGFVRERCDIGLEGVELARVSDDETAQEWSNRTVAEHACSKM